MIEETLTRIAVALERLAAATEEQGVVIRSSAQPPNLGPPPVAPSAAPPTAPMTAPGPSPVPAVSPPSAPVPAAPVPAVSPPSAPVPAAPVQAVPTLDDIRALANDFHRAHPERAAEVVAIFASANAKKLSEIPPSSYPDVHQQLKQLAGV